MKQLTPLFTAGLVVLALIGFMAFNATRAGEEAAAPAAPTTVQAGPTTTTATTARSAPGFPAEAVYAGKADDERLAVAIAVKGRKAAAYLCDGARVEAWLKGAVKDGRIEVASADGKAGLTALLDGGDVTGTATVGAQEYRFTLDRAKKPAGLYRGEDGSTTIGWIVLPDGSQVGIASAGSVAEPAPPLDADSSTATVNDRPVTAAPVSGDTAF